MIIMPSCVILWIREQTMAEPFIRGLCPSTHQSHSSEQRNRAKDHWNECSADWKVFECQPEFFVSWIGHTQIVNKRKLENSIVSKGISVLRRSVCHRTWHKQNLRSSVCCWRHLAINTVQWNTRSKSTWVNVEAGPFSPSTTLPVSLHWAEGHRTLAGKSWPHFEGC